MYMRCQRDGQQALKVVSVYPIPAREYGNMPVQQTSRLLRILSFDTLSTKRLRRSHYEDPELPGLHRKRLKSSAKRERCHRYHTLPWRGVFGVTSTHQTISVSPTLPLSFAALRHCNEHPLTLTALIVNSMKHRAEWNRRRSRHGSLPLRPP